MTKFIYTILNIVILHLLIIVIFLDLTYIFAHFHRLDKQIARAPLMYSCTLLVHYIKFGKKNQRTFIEVILYLI